MSRFRAALLAAFAILAMAPRGLEAQPQTPEGWRPFIKDNKGERPFPDDPGAIKDRDWLNVVYPAFPGGFKPRLAVVFSDNKAGAEEPPIQNETLRFLSKLALKGEEQDTAVPLRHVEDMVRHALSETGRFTMLERTSAMDDVMREQDLGASGGADRKTAAGTGQIKGANYLVKAAVIEINPEKESKDIALTGGGVGKATLGIGSVGTSGKVAFCQLSVHLVNVSTGEIVCDMIVNGTVTSKDVKFGGGMAKKMTGGILGGGAGVNKKEEVVISNAIQACANKVAYHTALRLAETPWEGAVINVDPVVINAGSNIGLSAGLELNLFSRGDEMIDEDGTSLGFARKPIGRVRIAECQERFSTCETIEGCEGVKKGDIVQLQTRR